MKAVILAGGYGTRISEESGVRPKPMVEIGGRPILWHIMKNFSVQGITEFIILCGYKSQIIKDYFINYALYQADVTFDMAHHCYEVHHNHAENWQVTLLETGLETMTGGRLKRAQPYLGEQDFLFTYGDGVSDVSVAELVRFHQEQGVAATVTAVQPPGRFGGFVLAEGQTKIDRFREKPAGDGAWISGGFFVLKPEVLNLIADDQTTWEQQPMMQLAQEGKLAAYRHTGFWHPMDTLRDKHVLEELWAKQQAPWKNWT